MASQKQPAAADREAAKLQVERMPLALCCDDPSEVRWRTACAGRRLWPLHWEEERAIAPAAQGERPSSGQAA